MGNQRGVRARWAILCGAALALAGCGPGEVKAPNPTRALEERRAIEVIRRAIQKQGMNPSPGRDVKLVGGVDIHMDVSIEGHDYGIVYVTEEDAQKLGNAIPKPNKRDERLRLLRAGDDGEVRVVLLYQDNYVYDDLAGESHEQTSITSERALTRDVEDFITHARTQKFR